jgi:hypothetical protein
MCATPSDCLLNRKLAGLDEIQVPECRWFSLFDSGCGAVSWECLESERLSCTSRATTLPGDKKIMQSLQDLIDSREIDLSCGSCRRTHTRPVAWVRSRREMACPECHGIIVLGTSELKGRIRDIERQMQELHRMLSHTIKTRLVR